MAILGVNVALHDFALGALQFGKARAGVALHALQVGADLPRLPAQFLARFFGARLVGALLEVDRLPVEPAHAVNGLVDAINQALALRVGEAQLRMTREIATCSRPNAQRVSAISSRVFLLRNVGQLLQELARLPVVAAEFVNLSGDVVQPVLHHLIGDLLFVEEHHFLDGTHARA